MVSQITEMPIQVEHREDTPNYKGYKWEMYVRDALSQIPSIQYEGNPTNYYEWLHEHNKTSYDGTITLPNGKKIHIEMKYRDVPKVYHSWFEKDWLPREADIIVTNNTNVISYADKRALDAKHIKLMSLSELIVYIGRITRNTLHPSKYLYFNCVLTSIIIVITRLFNSSLGPINKLISKMKGFKGKIHHKSNWTMFLKNQIAEIVEKFNLFFVYGKFKMQHYDTSFTQFLRTRIEVFINKMKNKFECARKRLAIVWVLPEKWKKYTSLLERHPTYEYEV